jgi:hypothetical protein
MLSLEKILNELPRRKQRGIRNQTALTGHLGATSGTPVLGL